MLVKTLRAFAVIFESLRPNQWIKNFFLFAGIIFSMKFFDAFLLLRVIYAFAIFCFLSSAIYLLNDVVDAENDRNHPGKKFRPVASGKLSLIKALAIAFILASLSLTAAFQLDFYFALVAITYLILMLLYSFYLKNIVILDIFSVAGGFVLRTVAGVVVIQVELSPWLIICTILLSLFIVLGKRRQELMILSEIGIKHRIVLDEYNPQLLDQLISTVAGSTIMAYALYTLWPDTVSRFKSHNLVFSIPFVLYGVFRYLYLIYQKAKGEKPEEIMLTDYPLIIDVALWIVLLMMIIYRFKL